MKACQVWGEEVMYVISDRRADDLIAHCRDHIAHFKSPRTVEFVPELPRSAAGKLLKRELRRKYWQ